MKPAAPDNYNGVTVLRVLVALLLGAFLPLFAFAAAPAWWSERGVTVANAAPDDYAPANQGQLKNIASSPSKNGAARAKTRPSAPCARA